MLEEQPDDADPPAFSAPPHLTPDAPSPAALPDPAPSARLHPMARVLIVALLIGAGALAGLVLTRGAGEAASRDALSAVSRAAADLAPEFETDSPDRARQFVADAYGRRIQPPELRGYALAGVAATALDADATTPAFLYDGPDGRLAVAVLDYAMLDAAGDRLQLGPDLRGLLSDDTRVFQRETDAGTAVLWRDRDDLFIAFPPDAQLLADAVVVPVR